MRKLSILPLALVAALFALSLGSNASADDWNKKTIVTFDQDVEIPGQVLPAGTYVFKLFPSNSDRFVVQVWTQGEQQLIATLTTIGDSFPNPSGDPYFVLDTSATEEGYPPAIVSWFFAGSDEGRDFVYSGYSNTRIVNSTPTYEQPQEVQPQPQAQPEPQPEAQPQPDSSVPQYPQNPVPQYPQE
jgi:hypothetical protein